MEIPGFTVSEHLRAIEDHVGPVVTDVLVDTAPLSAPLLRRYGDDGAEPVDVDHEAIARLGIRLHEASLHVEAPAHELRHDPERLARAVIAVALRGPVEASRRARRS